MGRGAFITFEGGEGTGKSTQSRLLHAALSGAGIPAVLTREPGGTPVAERIRALLVRDGGTEAPLPLTEALLLNAGRHEHVARLILPALDAGRWVVSDRFADSTRAMQGAGMGLASATIEILHGISAAGLAPDLTFMFDIDPQEGLARANRRLAAGDAGEDRYERMDLEFHRRLRQGFLDIAKADPERCVVVDAKLAPEAAERIVRAEVARRFSVSFPEAAHG